MTNIFSLTLTNDFHELERATPLVEGFLSPFSLSSEAVFLVHFAIEEIITNIIKYGYDDQESHRIDLLIEVSSTELAVSITDDGHEFDPGQAPAPDLESPVQDRKIGGLGIYLTRKMSSGLEYHRDGSNNITRVRIKRS